VMTVFSSAIALSEIYIAMIPQAIL